MISPRGMHLGSAAWSPVFEGVLARVRGARLDVCTKKASDRPTSHFPRSASTPTGALVVWQHFLCYKSGIPSHILAVARLAAFFAMRLAVDDLFLLFWPLCRFAGSPPPPPPPSSPPSPPSSPPSPPPPPPPRA